MKENLVVVKRGGGERVIPWYKWGIDRSTSHGEDADLFEYMPHGGMRLIDRAKIIRREPYIKNCHCGAVAEVWSDYCTGLGHGYAVICKGSHYGPHAVSLKTAVKLWNDWQSLDLPVEKIDQAISCGLKIKDLKGE